MAASDDLQSRIGIGFAGSQSPAVRDLDERPAGIGFVKASSERTAGNDSRAGIDSISACPGDAAQKAPLGFVSAGVLDGKVAESSDMAKPTPPPTDDRATGSGESAKPEAANSSVATGQTEEQDLSPAELERKKLAAFEEKLKFTDAAAHNMRQTATAGHETGGLDPTSVFVGGFDHTMTPDELHNCFKDCGPINRVTLVESRGFAYVEFKAESGLQNALLLNGSTVRGQQLKVVQKRLAKGKSKDKGKGKCVDGKDGEWAAAKGKDQHGMKGKGKDSEMMKGKSKPKGKFGGNLTWTNPNRSQPY